jgi:ankyrin repeat protein
MAEENKSGRAALDEQLISAVQAGSIDDSKKLISSGADVNHKDRNGSTVIFLCNTPQHAKILRFLVSLGAQVNCVNNLGNSPLHYAVERGCMEIILILMLNGADPSLVNQSKQKPEDLAPKLKPMIVALSMDRPVYQRLNDSYKKKLTLIFEEIDFEGTGILNLEKSMKFNRFMEDIAEDVARRDAQDFLRDVGICHIGQVNLDEWLFGFAKLVGSNGNESLEQFFEDYEKNVKDKGKFQNFTPKG